MGLRADTAVLVEDSGGVEVGLASTHADMQPVAGGAQQLSLMHPFASTHGDGRHPGIRHPQTVGMAHRDVEPPSHLSCEAHDATCGRPERCTGLRCELQAAIAWPVRMRRRSKRIDHRSLDRPDVGHSRPSCRRPSCRRPSLGRPRLRCRRGAADSQHPRCRDNKHCGQARGCADSYTSLRRSLLTRV